MAITPFKVTSFAPFCTVLHLAPFPSYGRLLLKFLLATGVPHFNAHIRGDSLRISGSTLPLKKN